MLNFKKSHKCRPYVWGQKGLRKYLGHADQGIEKMRYNRPTFVIKIIYSRVELTVCRVDLCRVDFLVNESTRHMCRVDRVSS